MPEKLTTMQKAFDINVEPSIYGTIAEIGAGQEVARYFFLAGGAAGTIAKTISAYDMRFSDALYGGETSGRYVSKSRLIKMLDTEYSLVVKRVGDQRPKNSIYFAFADTVTARSYSRPSAECHGWMGICLQLYPGAPISKIILHVRMLDDTNPKQQEAIGILGVNLIFGAFHYFRTPEKLIDSLKDNLGRGRIEVDMIHFEGPYFEELDNRLMALRLVEADLTPAVIFSPEKTVLQPSEVFYKKNILVLRSHFCPVTNVTVDMIKSGKDIFLKNPDISTEKAIILPELSLAQLGKNGHLDKQDILHRTETAGLQGHPVLVSNYLRYFRIREYLNQYTKGKVDFILGVPNLELIFDVAYYEGLEGGIMGAFSKLFNGKTKLFIYPLRKGDDMITADSFRVPDHLKHLYLYLRQNKLIQAVESFDASILHIWSEEVLKQLKKGRGEWENMVPKTVAQEIIKQRMFGFGSE